MESKNLQTTMSKHLTSQPVVCPWTSKAPLATTMGMRNIQNVAAPNPMVLPAGFVNNLPTAPSGNENDELQYSAQNVSLQHSSSQFFHFLRLMQLFPDVHPATLHSVMSLCKNDFFGAVDKLLYAKRCKNYYINNQRNGVQPPPPPPPPQPQPPQRSTFQRFQPYIYNNVRRNGEVAMHPSSLIQSTTVTGATCLKHPSTGLITYVSSESILSNPKPVLDVKKSVYRNTIKIKEKTVPNVIGSQPELFQVSSQSSLVLPVPKMQPENMTVATDCDVVIG